MKPVQIVQKYITNLVIGSIVSCLIFSFFYLIVLNKMSENISHVKQEILKEKDNALLLSDALKGKTRVFFSNNFLSPIELNKVLYDALKKHPAIALLNLTESTPVEKPIKDALGESLSTTDEPNDQKVKMEDATLQIMGRYLEIYKFLSDLEKAEPRIFWDSLYFRVTNYPKAVVTLKMHVVSQQ